MISGDHFDRNLSARRNLLVFLADNDRELCTLAAGMLVSDTSLVIRFKCIDFLASCTDPESRHPLTNATQDSDRLMRERAKEEGWRTGLMRALMSLR